MTDNVISIFKKKEEDKESSTQDVEQSLPSQDLEEIMKKNKARKEEQEKQRVQTNQSVLRSYKIKKK